MADAGAATLGSTDDEVSSPNKRRKLRKGTHSCWECKRRKQRCSLGSHPDATVCIACRRRGTPCVSQEVSEDNLLQQDLQGRIDADASRTVATERQASLTSTGASLLDLHLALSEFRNTSLPTATDKLARLSKLLHAALPPPTEAMKIADAGRMLTVLPHELMTMPYIEIDTLGTKPPLDLQTIPPPTEHPVLIARYMLLLASIVPHLPIGQQHELEGVSEPPRTIMERLMNIASSLVTTNDTLIGSIEGLQCIIIEAVHQVSRGNLRRSWVSCRRAITIAQLMGLDRPGSRAQYQVLRPGVRHRTEMYWFRIMTLDRLLCLMLGLSQGSMDRTMASETLLAGQNDLERLERIHCVIASRIIERNELYTSSRNDTLTAVLDNELQKAAGSMPSKFWLVPMMKSKNSNLGTTMPFLETRRMFTQVLHFNLLNQLHLPYLLRSSKPELRNEYSLITCINASREIIYRFITLHGVNGFSYPCRIIDFLTLMAAMTLLLAHLHSSSLGCANLLSHQRYSDRAMIEQVQELMLESNRVNSDSLSAGSADLLRRLLIIEADSLDAVIDTQKTVCILESGSGSALQAEDDNNIMSVSIPYFGVITIAREGICREMTWSSNSASTQTRQSRGLSSSEPNPHKMTYPEGPGNHSDLDAGLQRVSNESENTPSLGDFSAATMPRTGQGGPFFDLSMTMDRDYPLSANQFESLSQFSSYPGLAADGQDWAFQGMDSAFFERLMGAVDEGTV